MSGTKFAGVTTGLVLVLAVMTGCGGGDTGSDRADSGDTSPTATAGTDDLKTICPQVESLLNDTTKDTFGVPTQKSIKVIAAGLQELRGRADAETGNALDLLISAAEDAAGHFTSGEMLPRIDASRDLDGGTSAFAKRCKLAGSTALQ